MVQEDEKADAHSTAGLSVADGAAAGRRDRPRDLAGTSIVRRIIMRTAEGQSQATKAAKSMISGHLPSTGDGDPQNRPQRTRNEHSWIHRGRRRHRSDIQERPGVIRFSASLVFCVRLPSASSESSASSDSLRLLRLLRLLWIGSVLWIDFCGPYLPIMSSFVTPAVDGTSRALKPASVLSPSLLTTPTSVTCRFFTMMCIG